MQKKIKVSVIYVNYKSLEDIKKSIDLVIRDKPKVHYEIIVVDNDANVKLKKYLKGIKQISIKYIKSSKNLGYGTGNNLGAKYSKGEYIFILNPDTIITSNVIDELASFLDKTKKVAIAVPSLINDKGKDIKQISSKNVTPLRYIFTYTFIAKIFPQNKIKERFITENVNSDKPYKVEVVPGSALIIRKNVFEKLGGFDEKYFMYFEDNDICKRVIDAGYAIYKIPKAKVLHDWKPADGNKKLKNYFEYSRFYYFRKHFGLNSAIIVELFSRFNKEYLFLTLLVIAGLFLRLYKLDSVFPFSGEVGHNLLEIKNYFLNREVPLAGPPTSHPWLKFGPLFYWIYSPYLILSKFNPLSYAYFGAFISVLVIPLNYFVIKKLFDKRIAFISTILICFSPLYITFALHARFFNIVSILIYPFLYFLYKYIYEDRKYLFWVFFILGAMFNFHYSPILLIPSIVVLTIYKRIRIGFKNIMISLLGIAVPLIPLLLYDVQNKFQMTGKLILWIPYRVLGFFGLIPRNNVSLGSLQESINSTYMFISESFITNSNMLGLLITYVVIIYTIYLIGKIKETKKSSKGILLILCMFVIGIISIFIHGGSYILHYYLPLFPIPIILFSRLISRNIFKKYNLLIFIIVFMMVLNNIQNIIFERRSTSQQKDMFKIGSYIPLNLQKDVAKFIVEDSDNKPYSLKRVGDFDYYEENYAQNYQYLLWMYGNEPVKVSPEIEYTIIEDFRNSDNKNIVYSKGNILVSKKILK